MNNQDDIELKTNTFFNTSLDSLSHYGVAGMKWGVRNEETLRKYNGGRGRQSAPNVTRTKRRQKFMDRFRRNKGGSSTKSVEAKDMGKPKDDDSATSKPENLEDTRRLQLEKSLTTKNPRRLTDDELRIANQRLQDEITYRQRQAQLRELSMTSRQRNLRKLKKNVLSTGGKVINNVVTTNLTKALNNAIQGQNPTKQQSQPSETKKNQNAKKTTQKGNAASDKAKDVASKTITSTTKKVTNIVYNPKVQKEYAKMKEEILNSVSGISKDTSISYVYDAVEEAQKHSK